MYIVNFSFFLKLFIQKHNFLFLNRNLWLYSKNIIFQKIYIYVIFKFARIRIQPKRFGSSQIRICNTDVESNDMLSQRLGASGTLSNICSIYPETLPLSLGLFAIMYFSTLSFSNYTVVGCCCRCNL